MNQSYLLLGSNIGDSQGQLLKAIRLIEKSIGAVIRQSKLYQTAAWGNTNQADFLNQVIVVETNFDSQTVMNKILAIEKKMGRTRTKKYAPRIIDIDILFFNREIVQQEGLIIPHPEIQNRRFVLIPLNEIAPGLVHPALKKTIHHLLINCRDALNVKKF